MQWHQGSIPEAISEAKAKRAIFMVFVAGDDDQSQKMARSFEDSVVSQKLAGNCVAVKLEADGATSKQFSQIYPVVFIPSTYFIGINGLPLDVIGGHLNGADLINKINGVFELHEKDKLSQNVNETCSSSVQNTQVEMNNSNNPSSSVASLDDRVERAKVLIAQRNEMKALEEEEKEKSKEIDRRRIGKEVQKQKIRQEELEAKQRAEEISKERAEEKAARERIREQIARDRAERAAKYNAEKATEEEKRQELQKAKLKAEQEKIFAETALRSQFARIQFRLPDGTSVTHQFDASASLNSVLDFVKETVKPPFGSFTLSLAFPRREFTRSDYSQSLRDLQLSPSAAILILPPRQAVVRASDSKVIHLLFLMVSPLLTLWRIVQNFLFGSPDSRSSSSQGTSEQPRTNNATKSRSGNANSQETFGRRDGNIHRLVDDSSEDNDENNTWNGNSTQQM